ncbi:MAG: YqzL family protein [Alicyclobacillaceae bacterium]|nr:YqzL family protein [Alicyclobacillaceae bacterium]
MRQLSWRWFTNTGFIDAYLLYKEVQSAARPADHEHGEPAAVPDGEDVETEA